jgi:DNA polymerase-1
VSPNNLKRRNKKTPSKKVSKAATAVKRLYLVDAHAYLHRAYHALYPTKLKSAQGVPVWALFGFAKMLLMLLKRDRPDNMAVCFDLPGPTFRHEKFEDYKATRDEIDDDLIQQLERAEEMVRAMGLPTVAVPGYEADDLLATLARQGAASGYEVVVVSGDKDILQLVGNQIKVLNEAKDMLYDDASKVHDKLGVRPEQVVDYLAIVGDKVDNVPGVPGIGAIGAAKLLGEFGTLEAVLSAAQDGHPSIKGKKLESLRASGKLVRLSRELIRLEDKVPLKIKAQDCVARVEATPELVKLFSEFGFKSLLKSLGASAEPQEVAPVVEKSLKIKYTSVAAAVLAKDAAKAKFVGLAVGEPAQPDLLHGSGPLLALALPDGRSAIFTEAEQAKHQKTLQKVLSSESIPKIGHDLKECIRLLRRKGLALSGELSDSLLAGYCIDPARSKYDLGSLLHEFGVDVPEEQPEEALARAAALAIGLHSAYEKQLKTAGLLGLYRDVEMPLMRVLCDMEAAGVALDAGYLKKLSKDFDKRIGALKATIDKLAGVEINLKSPKQLAELLFETLGLPAGKKTKKGSISTNEETLRGLVDLHPIPGKIIEYRELTKLKSTYIDALQEKMDSSSQRVHTHFHQYGTATGRLSSVEPNLQNIPIRSAEGRKIRQAFVAEKGNVLLGADYSQIDLRVLAHLSGDETLCGAFRSGEDVHLKTASEVFDLDPKDVDKEMRRRAKAVNFGIVYGQNAHGLAQGLDIPFAQARDYIAAYKKRYSGVTQWIEDNLETAKRQGYVKTLLGRMRHLPDLQAKNFQVRAFNERVAGNTPIQGTSADIIKVAMINIRQRLLQSGQYKARMVLQVHDELVFELPKGEAKSFAQAARAEMENAIELRVPVVVDVKMGTNWNGMEDLA